MPSPLRDGGVYHPDPSLPGVLHGSTYRAHELVAAQESRVVRDRNDPILVISWIPHHVR
jgi:hypothetical protein